MLELVWKLSILFLLALAVYALAEIVETARAVRRWIEGGAQGGGAQPNSRQQSQTGLPKTLPEWAVVILIGLIIGWVLTHLLR